jgi:hypothetical protein
MYRYKLRAYYNSDKLLLEFPNGPESDSFVTDLMNAIVILRPVLTSQSDLWMNDETVLHFKTDFGDFDLSVDVWEIAFIMSENDNLILLIDSRLQASPIFEKVDISFEDFKKS